MNKDPESVPKRSCLTDRRVRRTQDALRDAMVSLTVERSWGSFTVRELLERADVGRSTFYSHYKSKDDLLFTSFERMLLALDSHVDAERLAPVRELFAHSGESNAFHQALVRARMIDRLYNRGISVYTNTIAARLDANPRPDDPVPATIRARALAGALFALLEGWVHGGRVQTPEQMDALFHLL